jgi:addiction module HigA family antidote
MAKTKSQTPGSVLKSQMAAYQLNPTSLSKAINANQITVRQISLDKSRISAPVALRLAKFFATKPEYWLTLQTQYDLLQASQDKALAQVLKDIKKVVKPSLAKKDAKAQASKKAAPKAKAAAKTVKGKAAAKPRGRKPKAPPSI